MTRRILISLDGRANFASLKSAITACAADHDVTVLCYAGAVSDRHGDVVEQVRKLGVRVRAVPTLIEGGPDAMAATVGATMLALAPVISDIAPDVALVVGDRYSVLPVAYAAALMNIVVGHVMGGEVSGTIDEGVRHAITKLAHIHFPATELARSRIVAMGEDPARVHRVGCPRIDFVRDAIGDAAIKRDPRVVVVAQHPVTTEYDAAYGQMTATLDAVAGLQMREVHVIWPNSDAGSAAVIDAVRERHATYLTHRALPPEDYARLLARAGCVVGNSSSAIREGAWIGVPAVNVGTRQRDRERGANVIDVGHSRDEIRAAVQQQLAHGSFESDPLYGDGTAGVQIAGLLGGPLPSAQKRWCGDAA